MTGDQLSFADDSLDRERDRVQSAMWTNKGTTCGVCGRFTKGYRRPMYGTQARLLIQLVGRFIKAPGWYDFDGRDMCKLVYWGLVEREPKESKIKGQGTCWKPTDLGIAFARDEVRVPKYCYMYKKQLVRQSTETVSIRDVLPEYFNYAGIWLTEVE